MKQCEHMRNTFFIINPASGNGKGKRLIPDIRRKWSESGINCEIYITVNKEDVHNAIAKAMLFNASEIVIVGGDGTIRDVINAMRDLIIPIGIIPCGTGNDFARSLRIPLETNESLDTILRNEDYKTVCPGLCNGQIFINVASFGIDAGIVKRTESLRKIIKGPSLYLIAAIIEILKFRSYEVTIKVDGAIVQQKITLAAVCNGMYYGGGMKIAPRANLESENFQIVVAESSTRFRLVRMFRKLLKAEHESLPEVRIKVGSEVQIESFDAMVINIDGDIIIDKDFRVCKSCMNISVIVNI